MPRTPVFAPRRQNGAVLIVSMLLLLVMTVLALGASQATRLQERITGNARDRDIAFQAAEAALRQGERIVGDVNVFTAPLPCDGKGAANCYVISSGYTSWGLGATYEDLAFAGRAWWTQHAWDYTDGVMTGLGLSRGEPQYLIEEVEFVPDSLVALDSGRVYYRIHARGEGGSQTTEVMLQSTYARRFN